MPLRTAVVQFITTLIDEVVKRIRSSDSDGKTRGIELSDPYSLLTKWEKVSDLKFYEGLSDAELRRVLGGLRAAVRLVSNDVERAAVRHVIRHVEKLLDVHKRQ